MDSLSTGLQSAVIAVLSGGLYFILRLRYRQPVLKPLGWVVPQMHYIVIALMLWSSFAAGIALYLQLLEPGHAAHSSQRAAYPGARTDPILEETLFRGCLMPLLAESIGSIPAIIITAAIFAIFHGPTNLGHCLTFTATGSPTAGCAWLRARRQPQPSCMQPTISPSVFWPELKREPNTNSLVFLARRKLVAEE